MYGNDGIFSALFNMVADFGRMSIDLAAWFFATVLRSPLVWIYKNVRRILRFLFRSFSLLFAPSDAPSGKYADDVTRAAKKSLQVLFSHPRSFPYVIIYYLKKAFDRYNFGMKTLVMWIIPLVVCGVAAFSLVSLSQKTVALEITADGEVIGFTENENVYLQAKSRVYELLENAKGNIDYPDISYSLKLVDKGRLCDDTVMSTRLLAKTSTELVSASGVYADGKLISVLYSESDARNVMNEVLLSKKAENDNYAVSFSAEIEIRQGLFNVDEISDVRSFRELISYNEDGESILGLKEVKSEVVSESVPYDKIEIKSSALYSGSQRVLSEGKTGYAQVTNFVTFINGERTETKEVSRINVTEPVPQRVQIGTKPLDEAYSNSMGGIFLWPIVGAYGINSDYGQRWGKLHAGLDLGMGNAPGTSLGKNIIAVASGVVQVAAVHSSYGYYLILDHGNGLQTLYAHCLANSFYVVPGQTVVAGQPIARVGSTGYSTGPHLHFEVRVNGNRVNPRPYLGI